MVNTRFPRARLILCNTFGVSAVKLLLASSISSRPRLARISRTALRMLARGTHVHFNYSIADKKLHGMLRLNHITSDVQSALELAVGDCYRLAQLPAPQLVIDGGGNIGFFALAAAARWPEAQIVVCEPVPHNASMIEDLLRINGLQDRITVRQVALSDSSGHRSFYCREANQGSFDPEPAWSEILEVPTAPLGKVVADAGKKRSNSITLVKLDIEGAEVRVLRDYFSHGLHRRMIIVMELHRTDVNRPIVQELARSAGFDIEFYEEGAVTAHCQLTSADLRA